VGIIDNKRAYQVAKLGSKYPLMKIEPNCCISVSVAKELARDLTAGNT
jgi:hypothetical protein